MPVSRFVAPLALVFLAVAPASAQPGAASPAERLELFAGYGFLAGGPILDGYGPGWLAGFAWRVTGQLVVVLEGGSNRLRQDVGLLDVTADFHQLMAGLRFTRQAGRVRPYAQMLVGGSRIDYAVSSSIPVSGTGGFDETRRAWQAGGGIEVPMTSPAARRFVVRFGIDYRKVHTIDRAGQIRVHTVFAWRPRRS